jgi:hypothetical protein
MCLPPSAHKALGPEGPGYQLYLTFDAVAGTILRMAFPADIPFTVRRPGFPSA